MPALTRAPPRFRDGRLFCLGGEVPPDAKSPPAVDQAHKETILAGIIGEDLRAFYGAGKL